MFIMICFLVTLPLIVCCDKKDQNVSRMLTNEHSAYWRYAPDMSNAKEYISQTYCYFDDNGLFLKYKKMFYYHEMEPYSTAWALEGDTAVIISGYRMRFKKVSRQKILLYNNYNGCTIDTLTRLKKSEVPPNFIREVSMFKGCGD